MNSKLGNTYDEAHKSRRIITKIENRMYSLTQEFSFVLVGMAIFLLLGLINDFGYPHFWVISAFLQFDRRYLQERKRRPVLLRTAGIFLLVHIRKKVSAIPSGIP